jgi:hypothetical protein
MRQAEDYALDSVIFFRKQKALFSYSFSAVENLTTRITT